MFDSQGNVVFRGRGRDYFKLMGQKITFFLSMKVKVKVYKRLVILLTIALTR